MRDTSLTPFGDIVELAYGAALPAQNRSGHGYPVYGSSGEVGRHREFLVAGPGIVVGRKGTVGAVVWSDESFWPIDTAYYAVPSGVDLRWLYWSLSHQPLWSLDSSTGVPGLNRNDVYDRATWVPPLPEQRRIAEILDTLDDLIRKTEQLIAKLKQVKQGLLHDLLTRGIDENGELRDPERHPEQFEDSPLGRIPKAWEPRELQALVDPGRPIVYGILMPGTGYPGGVPVVKVKDIRHGRIKTDGLLLTSPAIDAEYRRSRLNEGDLLFTIRGTVGRMAFVPGVLQDANITQDTARVAIVGTSPQFVAHYLTMPIPQAYIETHTIGVAVKGINLGELRKVLVPVPEREEADEIAARLRAIDVRIDCERDEVAKLGLAKSGLMEDLLTGRVRVTDLEDAA